MAARSAAKKSSAKTSAATKSGAGRSVPARAPGKAASTGKSTSAKKPVKAATPSATTARPRSAGQKLYWLVKTEPSSFSFDDLKASPGQRTGWTGVRNYQARNMMRDEMRLGDRVLVYHSNAEPSAAVGVAEVVRESHVDPTQFDPADDHFDPEADPATPRWYMVELKAVHRFARDLPLGELKEVPALAGMELLRKGSRLSVQPVAPEAFELILKLGGRRS